MSAYNFVKKYLPYAKRIERETGLKAEWILGQSGLETGWGKSSLTKYNLLFGKKAKGGDKTITAETWECTNTGEPLLYTVAAPNSACGNRTAYRVKGSFAVYDSPYDSFLDHAELLKRTYPKSYSAKTDEEYADGLVSGRFKYATAPNYKSVIKSAINTARANIKLVGAVEDTTEFVKENKVSVIGISSLVILLAGSYYFFTLKNKK